MMKNMEHPKAKIDQDGRLHIERDIPGLDRKWKKQGCPFTHFSSWACGTWCPLLKIGGEGNKDRIVLACAPCPKIHGYDMANCSKLKK